MSGSFFEELGIPDPDINLEVGSGTQAEQTAAIMVAYEKVLLQEKSDLCLVVGDVTSTMACSIAARKLGVPVAHVEGGIRSGDWTMPEEINRVVTDSITNWFFTTSDTAEANAKQLLCRHPPSSGECGWGAAITTAAACHCRRHARLARDLSSPSAYREESS
jgi:UDP-N-acetylglucosamine 2-epimerase (non-hydrolysing)